jgi:hypothetical protein
MNDWHPIETAPKDGTRILAYGICGLESHLSIATVKFDDSRKEWVCDPNEASEHEPEPCRLTHWMPLPEEPMI